MKTIAVYLDQNDAASGEWHRGIARFSRAHDDWSLMHMGTNRITLEIASAIEGIDGLLLSSAYVEPAAIAAIVKRGISAVNLIQAPPPLLLSAVCADNETAGRLAGEHLVGLGLRRFGYLALEEAVDNAPRRRGFEQAIRSAGCKCVFRAINNLWKPVPAADTLSEVCRWIDHIGRPCGVLAFSDVLASGFLRAIRKNGIRVPDDVALVGIDDNDVLCEYCNPPLSSVNLNNQVIAYEAAALLDRLMRSRRRPAPVQKLIPPIGVIERGSSQMLAARVLRLMMRDPSERLSIRQMAEHVQVSERTLESKFKRCLGRTPGQEMSRLRVERAKRLLVDTEKSIVAIADEAGFSNVGHFCWSFKKKTNMTPGQYRRSVRGGGE
jgi:LacI family transcriptional regulator